MEYEQPTYRGRPRKDDLQINNVGPNQLRFKTFAYSGETALFDGYGRVGENKQTEIIQNSNDNAWGLTEAQLLKAEELSDRAAIPYRQALDDLGFLDDKSKSNEDVELDDGPIVNEIIEGPSMDLKTRNEFLIEALKYYCLASKHGGRAIHFENGGASKSRIDAESEIRENNNRRGDEKFRIAFGALALEKSGLDENDIEIMARKEAMEFSKKYTGRKGKDDREELRRELQRQRKAFGWDEE